MIIPQIEEITNPRNVKIPISHDLVSLFFVLLFGGSDIPLLTVVDVGLIFVVLGLIVVVVVVL